MSSDDLVKVKSSLSAEGASVELDLSANVPGVLARLFPSVAARSRAKRLISTRILEKVQKGEALDSHDVQYATTVFGEAEAKWMRRQQIAARAATAIEEERRQLQLPPFVGDTEPQSGTASATADDWIDKFWDDAELVSDDLLQEIYARILAAEATGPGTCSLRTLRVLRYLDRQTAEYFGRLAPAIFNWDWVPREDKLQEMFGVTYDLILELDDAGLIDSNALISKTVTVERLFIRWGTFVLSLEKSKGLSFASYPLTRAGKDLARVAQVQRQHDHLFAVGRWFGRLKGDMTIQWAVMPNPKWQGSVDALTWSALPSEPPTAGAATSGLGGPPG